MFHELLFVLYHGSKFHTHVKQTAYDITITAFLENCRNINFKDAISSHRQGSALDQEKSET
jgi:hypothetical protein